MKFLMQTLKYYEIENVPAISHIFILLISQLRFKIVNLSVKQNPNILLLTEKLRTDNALYFTDASV